MNNFDDISYENRILNLKIANLQAIVCVFEMGSFSLAAQKLNVTQPTISRRIADLEAILDIRLFDRIGPRVIPTDAARLLYPKAKHILLTAEDTHRLFRNLSGKVIGQLNLGMSGYIAESYLRPIMQLFTSKHPEVELNIRLFGNSADAYHLLELNELDLALATLPSTPIPNLKTSILWQDNLVFVVSKSHPLAKIKEMTFDQLVTYPAIVPESGTLTRQIIDNFFAKHQLSIFLAPQISKPTNFSVIKMMVSIGLGWSILPTFILDKTFYQLPLASDLLVRNLGISQHAKRTSSNAMLEFIRICEDHCRLSSP